MADISWLLILGVGFALGVSWAIFLFEFTIGAPVAERLLRRAMAREAARTAYNKEIGS
jgi:hypothetical protein